MLMLHHIGRHVVRDHRHIEAHIMAYGRRQPRPLKIGPRLRAEQTDGLAPLPALLQHHGHNGLAEALGHDGAVVGKLIHQMSGHLSHPGIAAVVGLHRIVPDGQRHIAHTPGDGGLGRLKAAAADQLHPSHGGWPGMGNGLRSPFQIGHLLRRRQLSALIGCQRHTHSGGGERPCGLGHHIRQRLRHLHMGAAGSELHPPGVYPPVKDAHLTGIVPRHIFILHHKGKALVRSLHFSLLLPLLFSIQPLDNAAGIPQDPLTVQRQKLSVFI